MSDDMYAGYDHLDDDQRHERPLPEMDNSADDMRTLKMATLLADVRDGAWLDAQVFPPLRYAVPYVIPAGFTVLAGAPKIGKSWLAAQILLGIAAGGVVLHRIPVGTDPHRRRALYLALEDGDRRMQARCRRLQRDQPLPAEFHYLTKVAPGEVLATIEAFLASYPDTGLVIVDTLGKVLPPALPTESMYDRDYRIGGKIKGLADRYEVPILVNHHDRKANSEDFVERVSGTNGLAGAADTIIVLARQRHAVTGLLMVTGRDVPEGEYAVRFVDGFDWQLDGRTLAEAAATARRRRDTEHLSDKSVAIAEFVAAHPEGVSAKAVTEHFGDDAYTYLRRLVARGEIESPHRGYYAPLRRPVLEVSEVLEPEDQSDTSDSSNTRPERGD